MADRERPATLAATTMTGGAHDQSRGRPPWALRDSDDLASHSSRRRTHSNPTTPTGDYQPKESEKGQLCIYQCGNASDQRGR